MIEENKVELTRKRVELVEVLNTPLSAEERVRVQGALSIINAKIKAINTMSAAQLKVDADRRKVAGLTEFQANTARAIARVGGTLAQDIVEPEDDDDPGQTEVIDGWIDALLLRNDVEFTRSTDGTLSLDAPPKWAAIIGTLVDGVYAAARGQELPELPRAELKAVRALKTPTPKTPPPKAKPKKR